MSTVTITAADVNKLRQMTNAGMMDCKKALTEANGDFEKAVDILRKKGQKIAANRSDKEAKEGLVIAKVSADGKKGIVIVVNCETDFVAKNEAFGKMADTIASAAVNKLPADAEALRALPYGDNGTSIQDKIVDEMGKIGEKLELARYEKIEAGKVIAYNHPGNKLATIVGFSKDASEETLKNVAMQVAAMAPVSVDKGDVDPKLLEREMEIAREQIRQEGKPENMIDKIAQGKIQKFYKEYTLVNQEFIRDNKRTVGQYLSDTDKDLKVTSFKRIALG